MKKPDARKNEWRVIKINRLINIFALACHGLMFGYGVYTAISAYLGIGGLTETIGQEAIAGAVVSFLGGAIMLLLYFLALLFAVLTLIPLIMKIIRMFTGGGAMDVICAVFSGFITFFAILFTFVASSPLAVALSIICAVASASSLVLNLICSASI